MLIERLQKSARVTIDGQGVDTVTDLYLERGRALRTWTPAADAFRVDAALDAPQRIGTMLAWRTEDEIEISDDLIATYPVSAGFSPRLSSRSNETGEEVVHVVGDEPALNISMAFYSHEAAEPEPEQKIFRVMRALSPQRPCVFFGRNLSEAWIIGRSARRQIRYTTTGHAKQRIQPVNMEVL